MNDRYSGVGAVSGGDSEVKKETEETLNQTPNLMYVKELDIGNKVIMTVVTVLM